jgi:hypothetical protein
MMMIKRNLQTWLGMTAVAVLLLVNVASNHPTTTASARSAEKNLLLAAVGDDFSGNYKITSSSNPGGGGGSYGGTVRISRMGAAYRIAWTLTGGESYEGVGIQMGDALAVGWGTGRGKHGVVAYSISGGTLAGKWTLSDMRGAIGTEELAGSPSLTGAYKIVKSTTPGGGKGYAGAVTITPNGDTYTVAWKLASGESYNGVGVRQGDLLVVGWGISQDSVGVVHYWKQGAALQGVWAIPGGKSLGTETLTRQ